MDDEDEHDFSKALVENYFEQALETFHNLEMSL